MSAGWCDIADRSHFAPLNLYLVLLGVEEAVICERTERPAVSQQKPTCHSGRRLFDAARLGLEHARPIEAPAVAKHHLVSWEPVHVSRDILTPKTRK